MFPELPNCAAVGEALTESQGKPVAAKTVPHLDSPPHAACGRPLSNRCQTAWCTPRYQIQTPVEARLMPPPQSAVLLLPFPCLDGWLPPLLNIFHKTSLSPAIPLFPTSKHPLGGLAIPLSYFPRPQPDLLFISRVQTTRPFG